MRRVVRVIQDVFKEPLWCTTEPSGSNPFSQPGFAQLPQKAAILVQIRSTDPEQLPGGLREVIDKKLLSLSVEAAI